jgi:hypothetical protein
MKKILLMTFFSVFATTQFVADECYDSCIQIANIAKAECDSSCSNVRTACRLAARFMPPAQRITALLYCETANQACRLGCNIAYSAAKAACKNCDDSDGGSE